MNWAGQEPRGHKAAAGLGVADDALVKPSPGRAACAHTNGDNIGNVTDWTA